MLGIIDFIVPKRTATLSPFNIPIYPLRGCAHYSSEHVLYESLSTFRPVIIFL